MCNKKKTNLNLGELKLVFLFLYFGYYIRRNFKISKLIHIYVDYLLKQLFINQNGLPVKTSENGSVKAMAADSDGESSVGFPPHIGCPSAFIKKGRME